MKHALVAGAGGFVGTVLCRALRDAGVRVTAAHRRRRDGPWDAQVLCNLPAETLPAHALSGVDTVFHLMGNAHAADGGSEAAVHAAVSVDGTRALLEACDAGVQRFVYVSSVKAMGESTPRECVDESAPPRPETAYGAARLEAETIVLAAAERCHVAVLRLPLVYGPGVKGNLRRMLGSVRAGRMPLLPDFDNRRSMVHVEDVARCAISAATLPQARGRVYLLSDGHAYGSREIQQMMYAAAGRRPPFAIPMTALRLAARGGDVLRRIGVPRVPLDSAALDKLKGDACYDAGRARTELGWTPGYTLPEALPAMFAALAP